MPRENIHDQVLRAYVCHLSLRDNLIPPHELDITEMLAQLQADIDLFRTIKNTRYLNTRTSIPKSGCLHLAWEYAKNPAHHHLFTQMLCVSPAVFSVIIELIKDHLIFHSNSNVPQTPVDYQLAVTLYRMGRFGNAALLADVAREAGCSQGSVELWTDRCLLAIESLHDMFVRPLTPEEKEAEKMWMDQNMGFKGLWREGWLMYDGTIVVLYARPGMEGDAYYTRKCNYGLNLQVNLLLLSLRKITYHLSRLEMYRLLCALLIIPMGLPELLTTQWPSRRLQLQNIQNSYLKDKNLRGQIQHTHLASGLFLFTNSLHPIFVKILYLTEL